MKLVRINKTASTNDYVLKYLKKGEDIIVVSKIQTAGRGTKGRSFSSNEGGIYLSMLKFYNDLKAINSFSIIESVSLAVVKTLMAFNINAKIKWPNDIICNNKKICGILIENRLDGDKIAYSIIGLGLNVNNSIPKELDEIATSIKTLVGEVNFESVLMTLILNLSKKAEKGEYERFSAVINKEIEVNENGVIYSAFAKEILTDGRLVLSNGKILSAAEVKIKL